MGTAGANARQILGQFYPGTTIGKGSGNVRVPVLTGNNIELVFPEGGDIGSSSSWVRVAPGDHALLYRDGDGTRVRTGTHHADNHHVDHADDHVDRTGVDHNIDLDVAPRPATGEGTQLAADNGHVDTRAGSDNHLDDAVRVSGVLLRANHRDPHGCWPCRAHPRRNRRYRGIMDIAPARGGAPRRQPGPGGDLPPRHRRSPQPELAPRRATSAGHRRPYLHAAGDVFRWRAVRHPALPGLHRLRRRVPRPWTRPSPPPAARC